MKTEYHYIPAQPDFYTIEYVGGRSPNYDLTPIIGWQIVHNDDEGGSELSVVTVVNPVTVEGPLECADIVYPNGNVCTPDDALYYSIEGWLEDRLKKEADHKERRKLGDRRGPPKGLPQNAAKKN